MLMLNVARSIAPPLPSVQFKLVRTTQRYQCVFFPTHTGNPFDELDVVFCSVASHKWTALDFFCETCVKRSPFASSMI